MFNFVATRIYQLLYVPSRLKPLTEVHGAIIVYCPMTQTRFQLSKVHLKSDRHIIMHKFGESNPPIHVITLKMCLHLT